MQTMSDTERVDAIAGRLETHYGPIPWERQGDPLDVLILTILSQNTNDTNRDRAYAQLQATYASHQAMAEAPTEELAEAIRTAGMHNQKAKSIQRALRTTYERHGVYDLSHLEILSGEEALEELVALKGVGKKTAGIVLAFSLGKPYFPVDTHIQRITKRLRFVARNDDPHEVMNALVPDELKFQFHIHLIQHGRDTCKARKPHCDRCLIADLCPVPEEGLPD